MSHCDLLAFSLVLRINHKDVYVVSNTYLKCHLNTEMRWRTGAESIQIRYSSCRLAALCLDTETRESQGPSLPITVLSWSRCSPAEPSLCSIFSSLLCNTRPTPLQDSFPLRKHLHPTVSFLLATIHWGVGLIKCSSWYKSGSQLVETPGFSSITIIFVFHWNDLVQLKGTCLKTRSSNSLKCFGGVKPTLSSQLPKTCCCDRHFSHGAASPLSDRRRILKLKALSQVDTAFLYKILEVEYYSSAI